MQGRSQDKDATREIEEDWEEASFIHACQTFAYYLKRGKWGPKCYETLDDEAKEILQNIIFLTNNDADLTRWRESIWH